MKQLDKLLLKSIIQPFLMTFGIAQFVLVMQFLWEKLEVIMGKGASLSLILEFLFYLSIHLIPSALPIAVLVSCVMVVGNMAEQYELSSIKSAGISLLRVMLPLGVFATCVMFFSFYCADNLAPKASLKFQSRLYDMRRQKPTLSLEKGVFNDDFQNTIIRVGDKSSNGEDLTDILLYDHSSSVSSKLNRTSAKRGKMFSTPDQKLLVFQLYDGTQYQEVTKLGTGNTYPIIRTTFKKYTKVFDMGQFEIEETDESRFKSHYRMLGTKQLSAAIDSFDLQIVNKNKELPSTLNSYYYFMKYNNDTSRIYVPLKDTASLLHKKEALLDSLTMKSIALDTFSKDKISIGEAKKGKLMNLNKGKKLTRLEPNIENKTLHEAYNWSLNKNQKNVQFLYEYIPNNKRQDVFLKANSLVRNVRSQAEVAIASTVRLEEERMKFRFEYYSKYCFSAACLLFLFIGAPMGAIVRKGGFGFPILISIAFFVSFMVLWTFGKKIAESGAISPFVGVFLPVIVLLPIGVLLTYKAMNDSQVFNFEQRIAFFKRLWKKKAT